MACASDVVLTDCRVATSRPGGLIVSNRRLPSAPGGAFGDIVEGLEREGHLSPRQQKAAAAFLHDLRGSHGWSGGLVSFISERVDTGRQDRLRPPGGASIADLDMRLKRLHPHERTLLANLVKAGEASQDALSRYGRSRSGFTAQKTARAFSTGRISGLLESLADAYLGPVR